MSYYLSIITLCTIFTILVQSYNLILGYAGQFHLGHIAFFGIGAYTHALLTVKAGLGFFPAMIAAGLVAAFFGVLLGRLALPFKGHYLVIVSYGFSEIIRAVELNWIDLTNGSRGLLGITRPSIFGVEFGDPLSFMAFTVFIAVICHYVIYRIVKSPYGLLLEAVREDEIATSTIGRNVVKAKMEAMVISAFFAGIAGSVFAMYQQIVVPEDYGLNTVILILLMVILGGRGSFLGAILGTIGLYLIFEPLRFIPLPQSVLGSLRLLIYATLFICIMLYRPQGLIGRTTVKADVKMDR